MLFCVKSIPERENMQGISRKCSPPRSAPPAAFPYFPEDLRPLSAIDYIMYCHSRYVPTLEVGGAEKGSLHRKAVDGAGKVCYTTICVDACVAQLAEQLTRNEQVAGSNPATSSKSDRILLNTVTFITFQRICNE